MNNCNNGTIEIKWKIDGQDGSLPMKEGKG